MFNGRDSKKQYELPVSPTYEEASEELECWDGQGHGKLCPLANTCAPPSLGFGEERIYVYTEKING